MTKALALVCVCLLASACVPALREPPAVEELAGSTRRDTNRAETDLAEAESLYATRSMNAVRRAGELFFAVAAADPVRVDGLIGAAQAGVWLAGHEPEAGSRRAAAVSAVRASQHCKARAPERPDCDYWLAVSIGVQARERRATALDALPRMVELLESVIEKEPGLEHAGPHRVLALVLLRAPGWPTGPGDPDLGLEHAGEAVALAPDYPPNQLCLAEALGATEQPSESRKAYERAAMLARQAVAAGQPEADEWLRESQGAKGR